MTTIETAVKNIESTDFRNMEFKVGDAFSENGKTETVTKIYYDGKRLVRFWTARREGEEIAESHYSVNEKTGKEHQDYSGVPPLSSERYSELNKILNGFAK